MRGRRSLLGSAAGATLLVAGVGRQAAASLSPVAGGDHGLSRLRETPEGRPLPEGLTFTDAEGRVTGFEAFRGKGLVVNFWATWCPPCVAEMPALDRLHAMVARDGIEVLALSNDRGGRAQVEPFYQRTGLRHLGIWLDPRGATGRALEVRVLPTTLILDRRGLEVGRLTGEAAWDQPEVVAAIRRLTRIPATAPDATIRS
ncbi:TlpA family protein disulfide reductase [Falsiroseomonas ponticola]|uniref:TlpA family protein disulfide reductase n=1 Tax=Falsiroseomonas ponticola TaxID=2786951 RepID=UPI001931E4F9|nr:TlpA disulfide reductase family protein [Roseomonas ponticola]